MSTYNFSKTENLQASKLFDLSGWTTVVTGGGTGIGLMCAQTLVAKYVWKRKDLCCFKTVDDHLGLTRAFFCLSTVAPRCAISPF